MYIYLSNENDDAVYFDNFTVSDTRSRIIEENHYYAFGLRIAGVSSGRLPAHVPNRYQANAGAELGYGEWADGSGLELYETFYRSYSAQIGRFMQVDPLAEMAVTDGGYVYGGNNPVTFTDYLGNLSKKNDPVLLPEIVVEGLRTSDWGDGSWFLFRDQFMQSDLSFGDWDDGGGDWRGGGEMLKRNGGRGLGYNQQDPYIIVNGKRIPISKIKTGTEYFSHGYSSKSVLLLDNNALNSYLKEQIELFGELSSELGDASLGYGIIGTLLKSWFGIPVTGMGLESSKYGKIASLFIAVELQYSSQNLKNGLYVTVEEVGVSPGWGAAVSYQHTSLKFYHPQGKLFKEIDFSLH